MRPGICNVTYKCTFVNDRKLHSFDGMLLVIFLENIRLKSFSCRRKDRNLQPTSEKICTSDVQDLLGTSFVELVSCHHLQLSKWCSSFKKEDEKFFLFALFMFFFHFTLNCSFERFNTNLHLQMHN